MVAATKTNTFSFAGLELRCVTIEGQPWFVAGDACKIIGLAARQGAYGHHTLKLNAEERRITAMSDMGLNGRGRTTLVSESGLYKLVMRSDQPQARKFQDWVTKTVLPAIRQTGGYIQGEEAGMWAGKM